MKVIIIGSGNVASVLGKKILAAGHEIIQVAGRNVENLASLSSSLKTTYTTNLLEIKKDADIYIISVSDLAIGSVISQLKLKNQILVHTAGSVSKDALATGSANYGILYPLQSLKKEVTIIPGIPVLVDANNVQTQEKLEKFASSWSDMVSFANDDERLKLHLAAVFVNNFTNHLIAIADEFCSLNQLNFKLLLPLIEETILRIKEHPAVLVQTGPARRNDHETMEKHRKLLQQNPGAT